MRTRHSILGLLAFALIVAVAGAAYAASCSGSNRVFHSNAECLHGWWDNNEWPKDSTFGVQGSCSDWGTVVAKIELVGAMDRTWHLNNDNKRRGSSSSRVNGIHCCKDVGDLCNHDDMMTPDNCKSQFEDSPAANTCYLSGGQYYGSDGLSPVSVFGEDCHFWAKCEYYDENWLKQENETSIEGVWYPDADTLRNCDGELKIGRC